jgi:predicted nucleic acid-binding protein
MWPPLVPSVVLVEATSGRPGPDANTNRLLKTCEIVTELPEVTARRAAELRRRARRGSAVDAVVIAVAEPRGTVLTGDPDDLRALADHSEQVTVETT